MKTLAVITLALALTGCATNNNNNDDSVSTGPMTSSSTTSSDDMVASNGYTMGNISGTGSMEHAGSPATASGTNGYTMSTTHTETNLVPMMSSSSAADDEDATAGSKRTRLRKD